MKAVRYIAVAGALLAAATLISPLTLSAQQATAAPTLAAGAITGATTGTPNANANVVITSPQLVSELHGTVQVMGTASISGMRSYFLETRALNPDASIPSADTAWIPATLPASTTVQSGVLASWDTTLTPDGLYELRLTVTTDNVLSTYFVVTPLRINNAAFMSMTAAPTSAVSGVPTVTAQLSANIRSGDSIYYSVIGYLTRNSSASVLGVSSTGSGWFYIQLSDGTKGWIAPTVVLKSGDFSNVPVVNPPPALPAFTSTAISSGLLVNGIALNPAQPVCGIGFNIAVNVNNPGKSPSVADKVYIHDVDQTSGTITQTAVGAIPVLNPGANFVVTIPLTVTTYYNAVHQVQATIDGSQITTTYTLGQGSCNLSSGTPTNVPATNIPPTKIPATTAVPTIAASATVAVTNTPIASPTP